MARHKTRAANLPVPQTREQAQQSVTRIGQLQRDLTRMEVAMNDVIAAAKAKFEEKAAPLNGDLDAITEGLRVWADANRDELTDGGKTKTADLGTGKIAWRMRPPSVRAPKAAEKLAEVIAWLRKRKLERFIRVSEEIDREAMLREPALVAAAPGVSIASAGEDFIVEPVAAELTGGAS